MNQQPTNQQNHNLIDSEIKEKINNLSEIDDFETLNSILNYVINTKDEKIIGTYVLKLIELFSFDNESIQILNYLTQQEEQLVVKFISPFLINSLYLKYIELSEKGILYNKTKEIAKILIKWTKKLPHSLHLDELFNTISNNTFSYFSDEYPVFIDNLISKNDSLKIVKKLLIKMLKYSVPARYSSWIILNLFDHFHEDKGLIQNATEILVSQLKKDEQLQNRSFFAIYFAFKYESNYFRLDDSNFGFTQNFSLEYNQSEITFDCSFHPFNTTIRLYAVVSEKLEKEINSFVIKLNEDLNETTIPYNVPLQVINMKPFQTIKLNVIDISEETLNNVAEPIRNAKCIQPTFIQNFQDHIELLWNFLKDDKYKELAFEMILLYEQFQSEKSSSKVNPNSLSFFHYLISDCPFQSILLGECQDPFEFSSNRRVFPTAIKTFSNTHRDPDDDSIQKVQSIIQFLMTANYDVVNLAIICSSVLKMNAKFSIPKEIIQKGLIECRLPIIRDLILKVADVSHKDQDSFMSLMNVALLKKNRTHTKQFFECVKKLNLPSETFVPFYESIDQLEYSHYKDPDETFICLLDLIPINEYTVNLTIDRLFSPPTCKRVAQPFVHTIESWTAALKFLLTPIAVKKLNELLTNLQIPCISGSSLSSDFTYKGRNGIYNLGTTCYVNALLQVFNIIQPLSLGLISYNTSQLTQFEIEMRNILAQLRYVRETVISTASFVENISNFENVQQDAVEFMEGEIIKRMNLDLESSDLTDVFHGEIIKSICSYSDGAILSQNKEDFYILPLLTKQFDRLDEAFEQYFIDDQIEGGYPVEELNNEKVKAYHHKSISKWPNCLALQLQRWEYSEKMGDSKLVDRFGFPIEINPNDLNCSKETVKCDFKYHLVGVVIHQGTAEQGHYYAVVEGEDKEWYLCNDSSIVYFDIKELPEFAFGGSESSTSVEEDISTAYLLFYCREDMPSINVNIPKDLEEKLNTINMNSWPQTIFRNSNFLTYVRNLLETEIRKPSKTFNKGLLYLGFHAFIKIAMCDEKIFNEWNDFLQSLLFNNKDKVSYALAFFDYINDNVGKSLLNIFNRGDNIIRILTDFISSAMLIANTTLKPLEIIMSNIDLKCGKKQVLNFAFELIEMVCKNIKINWTDNIDSLQQIYQFFLTPITKDLYKLVGNTISTALNSLLGIYVNLYAASTDAYAPTPINKAISYIFNMNNLNAIATSLKKSENFDKLMDLYHNKRPDIFFNRQEATPQTKAVLSKIFTKMFNTDFEDISNLDLEFNLLSFRNLMFSKDIRLRQIYSKKLSSFIESNQIVKNFLNQKLLINHFKYNNCKKNYTRVMNSSNVEEVSIDLNNVSLIPNHSEDSSIVPIVLGLMKKFSTIVEQGFENLTVEYTDLLVDLSSSYPLSFCAYSETISKVLMKSTIQKVKLNLIEVLRNIIACNPKIAAKIINNELFDSSERILSSDVFSPSAIELLSVLFKSANGSNLLAACTKFYLCNNIDIHGQMLIDLLLPPYCLKPPLFEFDGAKPVNILQIIIAMSVLASWRELTDENNHLIVNLKIFLKNALDLATPAKLYMLSNPYLDAVKTVMDSVNDE